jgi:hypothetical protein
MIAAGAPVLHALRLADCTALRTPSIASATLKLLTLKQSQAVTNLALTCPQLERLDLSFCAELPDSALESAVASCPMLHTLVARGCALVTPRVVSPNLRRVDLSLCSDMTAVIVSCPRLVDLGVGMSLRLKHVCLESSLIATLDLSMLFLQGATLHCPALTEVNFNGCCTIEAVDLRCPMLRRVTACASSANAGMFPPGCLIVRSESEDATTTTVDAAPP